jgi:heme exporter protein B
MLLLKEIKFLLQKEVVLEWRSKHALNAIVLYVVSTIFVCYLSFKKTDPITWNALFWIIMLFASINAVSKSFSQESKARHLYYYTICSAGSVILSKIIYNIFLLLPLTLLALLFYSIVFNNPVGDPYLYIIAVVIGSVSFSTVFTMISAIASKAGNSGALIAILGFPVIIPLLIVLIKLSKNAMDGLDQSVSNNEIGVLAAINVIVITASLILFPYLWRE